MNDGSLAARRPPIFIGGMFRSGTSLLRAMLGQHGAIAAGLETYWFEMDFVGGTGRNGEPLLEYVDRLSAFFDLDAATGREIAQTSRDSETFLDRFMGTYATKLGKRRWAEKTPANVAKAPRIFRRWPQAKVIQIVRDPRDVFASLRETKKWDDVETFATMWSTIVGGAEEARRSGDLNSSNYRELRYEALVLDPVATMRPLVSFLGEEWDPAVGKFEGSPEEYERVRATTGRASRTLDRLRQPLTDSRVGTWRTVLPESEVAELRVAAARRGLEQLYDRFAGEPDFEPVART